MVIRAKPGKRRPPEAVVLANASASETAVLGALGVAVYTTDVAGRITFFNEAAVSLWGRTPVPGKDHWCGAWRMYRPDDTLIAPAEVSLIVTSNGSTPPGGFEIVVERPDGSRRNVLHRPSPLYDASGQPMGTVVVAVDVTKASQAHDLLQSTLTSELAREAAAVGDRSRAESALQESLSLKDQFVDLVSHELKGPITVIMGNGALLRSSSGHLSDPDAKHVVDDIIVAAETLNETIDNLLVLTKLETGGTLELEPVRIGHHVSNCVKAWLSDYPERDVSVHVRADVPLVAASPSHLAEVLENMLSNAHKYSPPGSPVEVVVARSQDNRASVRVLDRGIGFSEEQAEKLFIPFYRSDPARKLSDGAGLGMTLCKRIIEAQGGAIHARPRPDGGAEFSFSLPGLLTDEVDAIAPL